MPGDYQRKQTTVNGERFITPELKEIESKILGADERAKARELELFQKLRGLVLEYLAAIQETAFAIGQIDVLAALAESARLFGYCQPTVDDSGRVSIETHIFEFDRDLYGAPIRVGFVQRLRDERTFESLDALKTQIQADCDRARMLFRRLSL